MLKRYRTILIAIIFGFHLMPMFLHSHQIDTQGFINLEKNFYVAPDQIKFLENKIYVQIEDLVYETPAIYSDENGYHIHQVARSGHCSWYEWECTNEQCLVCNLRGVDWVCRVCGRSISE